MVKTLKALALISILGFSSYPWWSWWIGPQGSINQETVKRIRPGMTLKDAEGVIGGPAGYYTKPRLFRYKTEDFSVFRDGLGKVWRWWVSDTGRIEVCFFNEVVVDANYKEGKFW
jgi:hypothetical protein